MPDKPKTALWCRLFGHTLPKGYGRSPPYLDITRHGVDGIGREHASLYAKCRHCDQSYHVASVHLPKTWREEEAQQRLTNAIPWADGIIAAGQAIKALADPKDDDR